MAWFVVLVLALVVLLALLAVLAMAGLVADDGEVERARIEMEVRQAERRLHNVARDGFEAMLEEARLQARSDLGS